MIPITLGKQLRLRLDRVGDSPGEGIGTLADGTVVVVEQGASHIGDQVTATVTSLLEIPGGYMAFARLVTSSANVSEPVIHAEDAAVARSLAVNLVVLRTRDLGRLRRFYEALGICLSPCRYGDSPDCFSARLGHVEFELQPAGRRSPSSGLTIGFQVPSVREAVRAAEQAGGTVATEPAKWTFGWRAAVIDPDGNRVELSESDSGRPTGDYPE